MSEREVRIVTFDEIIALHDAWLEKLGGQPAIFNPNVLMYAYEAQMSPYYETIFQKAASFSGRITKEHAFNDGNKRTGFFVIHNFLRSQWLPASADFRGGVSDFAAACPRHRCAW